MIFSLPFPSLPFPSRLISPEATSLHHSNPYVAPAKEESPMEVGSSKDEAVIRLPREPQRTAEEVVVPSAPKPKRVQRRTKLATQVVFRSVAAMSTFAAAMVIFFDEQTTDFGGFTMHADYKSSPAFRFFMIGNFAAAGYQMLSLILVSCKGTNFFTNLMDLMVMSLVASSAAAAIAIGQVGKKGNNHTGWMPVCNYFEKYCNRVEYSIASSSFGFLLLLVVCALNGTPNSGRRSSD